jgi:hypothetical protein
MWDYAIIINAIQGTPRCTAKWTSSKGNGLGPIQDGGFFLEGRSMKVS